MFEVPFEVPAEEWGEEEINAKRDERAKIVADWAKKMKKKKFGEEEEKALINEYNSKLVEKIKENLQQSLDNFDESAEFEKC